MMFGIGHGGARAGVRALKLTKNEVQQSQRDGTNGRESDDTQEPETSKFGGLIAPGCGSRAAPDPLCDLAVTGTRHRLVNWTCGGASHVRDRLPLLAAVSSSYDGGDNPGVCR